MFNKSRIVQALVVGSLCLSPCVNAQDAVLLHEDFESAPGAPDYKLPSGWSTRNDGSESDDVWKAGTLSGQSGEIAGTSGSKYAFLLPSTKSNHDTWMFTPTVHLEEGKEYIVQCSIMMPANTSAVAMEQLSLQLCPVVDGQIMEPDLGIYDLSENITNWGTLRESFVPTESGDYVIGFWSTSVPRAGGILIDDLILVGSDIPGYFGEKIIFMPDALDINQPSEYSYAIKNTGKQPLTIQQKTVSEGIELKDIPASIMPGSTETMTICVSSTVPGTFIGSFTLSTNDPLNLEATVTIYQEISHAAYSKSEYVDFEDGTPEGFSILLGAGNILGVGVDGSRAFNVNSYYGVLNDDKAVGFSTNFVELGEHPVLSFLYSLKGCDIMRQLTGQPVKADKPLIEIFVTDENGQEKTLVHTVGSDGDQAHVPVMDFQKVFVDLSAYAGKTARAVVRVSHASKDMMEYIDSPFDVTIDNLMFGTQDDFDIALSSLTGEGLHKAGDSVTMTAAVANHGAKDIDQSYNVNLKDDEGNVLASVTGEGIEVDGLKKVNLTFSPSKTGCLRVRTEIESQADSKTTNNSSRWTSLYIEPDGITHHEIRTENRDSLLSNNMQLPVDFYAVSGKAATLYYANELDINRGKIEALKYYVSGQSYKSEPFKIYVGETDRTVMDKNTPINPDAMTLVFEGTIDFPKGAYEWTIPFAVPFDYHGGNLIVYAEHQGREFVYGRNNLVCVSQQKRTLVKEDNETEWAAVEVYPALTVCMQDAASGRVKGKVVDASGSPLPGVSVSINGESMNRLSDRNGLVTFGHVAAGNYEFTAYIAGYDKVTEKVNVTENSEATPVFRMTQIQKANVSGHITDHSGAAIQGVKLYFTGETSASAVTDEQGFYSVPMTINSNYSVSVTADYHAAKSATLKLGAESKTLDFVLDEFLTHPYDPKVAIADGNVEISWQRPRKQLRHDTDKYEYCLGYDRGYSEIIFGSAYMEKATVKEVSFYISSEGGAHDNFNVYVFGLTDGKPDKDKILYHATNVDVLDDAWNTHVLTRPVTADGFMIAVSCDGFMGIGVTKASDDYPYVPNGEYYAGDSYKYVMSEMSTFDTGIHWMLRAGIENPENGSTQPAVSSYAVEQSQPDDTSSFSEIGTTPDLKYVFPVNELSEGYYRWRINARYVSGASDGVLTPLVSTGELSVDNTVAEEYAIEWNQTRQALRIAGADRFRHMAVVDINGTTIYSTDSPDAIIDLASIPAGAYVVCGQTDDNTVIVKKFIK